MAYQVNVKNMMALADFVEQSETYDQRIYDYPCGTPGCIAGHAAALFGIAIDSCGWLEKVRAELGLESRQAAKLFIHAPWSVRIPSRYDAAATIRETAKTGYTKWVAVRP